MVQHFFNEDAERLIEDYRANPIVLNRESVGNWVDHLAALDRVSRLDNFNLSEKDLTDYSLANKVDVKAPCDQGAALEYKAIQTIVCHSKDINAVASPMFMQLRDRFLALLKPNVIVNMKKDPAKIEELVNHFESLGETLNYIENDFSKYDKSQQETAITMQWMLYRRLGLDEEFLLRWENGARVANARSVVAGIKVLLIRQMRSGVAPTTLGNTGLGMMSVVTAYLLHSFEYAIFIGDDSLIASKHLIEEGDAVDDMAFLYNLSAKLTQSRYGYICSNFIVKTRHGVRLMADLVKRIEKLGQVMPANEDDIKARYISLCDVVKTYDDERYYSAYAEALAYRYRAPADMMENAMRALYTVASDYDTFRALYDTEVTEFKP